MKVINLEFPMGNPSIHGFSPSVLATSLDALFGSGDYRLHDHCSSDAYIASVKEHASGVRVTYESSFNKNYASILVNVSEDHGNARDREFVSSEIMDLLESVKSE